MLDINLIRKEPEKVKEGIQKKNANPQLVDQFLAADEKWRDLVKKTDELRAQLNKLSKNIAASEGGEPRPETGREEAKKVKQELKSAEAQLPELEKNREAVLYQIPNLPDDDAPVSKDASGNKVLRKHGEIKDLGFPARDHLELGEKLGIIDAETAAKVSGSRFAYLKGAAALLEFAIIRWVFDVLGNEKILKKLAPKGYSAKPFTPVLPPVMIKPEVFKKMGRLDPGQEEERYHLQKDNLYLIGSAEHTMGAMHMDENIAEDKLPLRYVGFSTSFRREAGSYGKDVKGILRQHQFDKLEIESFTAPENSRKEQDFIVAIQEHLMKELELPYQVVAISTGDMGGPDARQIDIETWMPAQGQYRETHTSDMMTDYQARRLGTKIRRKDGKAEFVHMNDATVFAIGRILIAILENYQQKDGSVKVPKILQKYSGLKEIKA